MHRGRSRNSALLGTSPQPLAYTAMIINSFGHPLMAKKSGRHHAPSSDGSWSTGSQWAWPASDWGGNETGNWGGMTLRPNGDRGMEWAAAPSGPIGNAPAPIRPVPFGNSQNPVPDQPTTVDPQTTQQPNSGAQQQQQEPAAPHGALSIVRVVR